MTNRREFLNGMVGAGMVAAAAELAGAADKAVRPGLELYSVRHELERDVPGTLAAVRKLGFTEVETGSLHGHSIAESAALLKSAGLRAVSVGASYEDLRDKMDSVREMAETFAAKWAMVAWIPHHGDFTVENAKHAAHEMNGFGESLAKQGVRLAFHPHGYEFRPHENGTVFDVLAKESDPKTVFFELDTFWAAVAGQDCQKFIERHGSRVRLLHLKDLRKGAPTGVFTGSAPDEDSVAIGDGAIDWRGVLGAARKAGVEHYLIEDESPAVMEQLPRSLKFLQTV
jgi:sugar phosphate isomerase/epimerase